MCPLPLVPSLGTSEKSLDSYCSLPPIRYLHTLVRSPLTLLISRLNSRLSPETESSNSLSLCYMKDTENPSSSLQSFTGFPASLSTIMDLMLYLIPLHKIKDQIITQVKTSTDGCFILICADTVQAFPPTSNTTRPLLNRMIWCKMCIYCIHTMITWNATTIFFSYMLLRVFKQ